ncbi:hypothetical protein QFZ78_005357 [Paenibacillus sp. V4I5]|nr:hypothetical protein [Paenibacillus sp. V4I5]
MRICKLSLLGKKGLSKLRTRIFWMLIKWSMEQAAFAPMFGNKKGAAGCQEVSSPLRTLQRLSIIK